MDLALIYAHPNRPTVARLRRVLSRYYSVWWDELIHSGDYRQEIEKQLESAKCVIPVWCSVSRSNANVTDEANFAKKRNIPLLPVKTEEVERRMLVHSPFAGVKLFNEAKHRKPPRTISFADETRILMCCDFRLRTIVATLLDTGMRVGIEALRLKWSAVDFEASVITVAQSKTAAGLRTLPMTEYVKSELQKWHAATDGISEYVFFNPQQPSTHIRCVKTAWHTALKLAGFSRFPIYQCRHNFATRLAAAGVSDTIIDQLLGHSRRDVLRFYTARVSEYLRDAINLLEKLRNSKTGACEELRTDVIKGCSKQDPTLIN